MLFIILKLLKIKKSSLPLLKNYFQLLFINTLVHPAIAQFVLPSEIAYI